MSRRRRLVRVAQYVLGALALGWVLLSIEWGRVREALGTVAPLTLGALLAVTVAGLLARFYTWHVLLSGAGETTYRASASVDLAVKFVNQLLPSRVSGRSVAPLVVRRRTGQPWSAAVAVTNAHTGLYAVLYGLVAVLGLGLIARRLPPALALVVGLSTALYVAAGAAVLGGGARFDLVEGAVRRLAPAVARVPRVGERLAARMEDLSGIAVESADLFRSLLAPGRLARYALGWTVVLVLVPAVRVWLLFSVFGHAFAPAVTLPFVLVAAYSVTLLPLTPGGIGVTEATATAVFAALGVPVGIAAPAVFLDRALGGYLPALAGWYPAVQLRIGESSG